MAVSTRAVYLARHGETESNRARLYAGRSAEPLTRAGRNQVIRLAEQLESITLSSIWTSSVDRALESARLVGDRLGLPVRVDERLDEMQLGPWEGRTEDEVARDFPDAYALWLTQPDLVLLEGRETLAELAARVTAVVADAQATGESVLLMTHVAPIRVAVLSSLRYPLSAYKQLPIPNACCIRLEALTQQAARFPQGGSLRVELERAGSAAA
jgi:broad specificity phosphatase PhoE